jgi:uncharacterized membrane protein
MKNYRVWVNGALAMAGLADALYLLTVHWGWWQAVCLGVGECEVVNTSIYSQLFGIPVALLGAFTYAALLATSVLIARAAFEEYARRAQFFIAALGVAFSVYLTYIEVFVLHTICPWCVLSAILLTIIAVLSGLEFRALSLREG